MTTTAKKRTKRAKVTLATINRMLAKDLGLDPSDLQMWRDRDRTLYWGGNLAASWESSCAETLDANSQSIEAWRDETIDKLRDADQLAAVDPKFLPSLHDVAIEVQQRVQTSIEEAQAAIRNVFETLGRLEEYHDDATTDDTYRGRAKLGKIEQQLEQMIEDSITIVDVFTCAHNARLGRREDELAGVRDRVPTYD